MKLIVGLGNPGDKYKDTRHNLGFFEIDKLSSNENFTQWKLEKKCNVLLSFGEIVSEKVILVKPQTYMNNSGIAVAKIANYYKISPSDIIVIQDDLDLPLGVLRISHNASSGGHKGIQSIIENIKSQEFIRLRIGIAGEKKGEIPAEDYVLEKFSQKEKDAIDSVASLLIEAIETTIGVGALEAMNEFN